jgi:hypothetical protein
MQKIGIPKTQIPLQRIAVVALGWIFIFVGIVGLFLPFVPGTLLIVAGALMLNPQCPWLRRAREKCRERVPALEHAFKRLSTWGKDWQRRFSNNPSDSGSQFRV